MSKCLPSTTITTIGKIATSLTAGLLTAGLAVASVGISPAYALRDTSLDATQSVAAQQGQGPLEDQTSAVRAAADDDMAANGEASETMPGNPTVALPDTIASSIPDSATVVSEDYATTADGKLKDIETGKTVTDPELVGTADQAPDPLSKTDGESFIPVGADEVRDAVEQSAEAAAASEATATTAAANDDATATVRAAALDDNEYGAHWGTYNGSPAFFDANNKLFVQKAKGVIDVSEWQGSIDWAAAKADGVEGAIIRIGYGTAAADKYAKRNIQELKRLGIPFGVYLYSYAYDNQFAADEAKLIVSLLKQYGVSPSDLSYPVYYDLERWTWTGHTPPTEPAVYDGIVNTWYDTMRAAGYTNLSVYSYTSYLNGALNSANIHSKTRWVAQYGAVMQYTAWPSKDRGWQYTSGGSVDGISGRVDLNAFGTTDGSGNGGATGGNGSGNSTSRPGKWVTENGTKHWYENGKMVRSKEIYDPSSDAWYWLDADGSMARNKDVYMPKADKWVRYDANGHMIKGEDYRYGGWYYFDPVTGAMAKGMKYVRSNGGKWVYYDWTTGKMRYGEVHVNYDRAHTGWYLFDSVTGKMFHGFTYIAKGDKWVYYDQTTGIMAKGYVKVNNAWYYFDKVTGKMAHGVTWVPSQEKWLYFDPITGRHAGAGESVSWRSASGPSQPKLSKYSGLSLEVRLSDQVVLVKSNGKTIYAMIASTGTNGSTPKGSYVAKEFGSSFYDEETKQGGKFWIGLDKGDIRFQSVPTDEKGDYIAAEGRKLGKTAGTKNIRLTVADASWLNAQLPKGTPVRIV